MKLIADGLERIVRAKNEGAIALFSLLHARLQQILI
jgi:hypothetical protein